MTTARRLACFLVLTLAAPPVLAQDAAAPAVEAAAEFAPQERGLTLAVLDFDVPPGEAEGLGAQIAEALTAMLSGESGVTVVDRTRLASSLQEHELALSGVADGADAPRIGRLVGAKLLVVGRSFELGKSRMLTAKLIGTETTLTTTVMAKGNLDAPIDEMVVELGGKLIEAVANRGPELVASSEPVDPIPALTERLKGAALPVVAVAIPEEHRFRVALRPDGGGLSQPPDPAVETEIKKLLIDAGADVRDVPGNELAEWVARYNADRSTAWPQTLEGVELVIVGEAFSETGLSLGNLRTASARAEINVISRHDGRIVRADRTTTRAVDVAEAVAGKTALEKAGRQLGAGILQYLAHRPAAEPAARAE